METTASEKVIRHALETVNLKYGYDLIFNRHPEKIGRRYRFTIRSKVSQVPGASVSATGRNSVAASWRAHGYLFDEILRLDKDAMIKTARAVITREGGNWQDYNIGSQMAPFLASGNAWEDN